MAAGFPPQMLPPDLPALGGGHPAAPPGTIFVKSAFGGYAVPPRKFTVYFGRGADDVHVLLGADDTFVSRQHGIFTYEDGRWWLRCEGSRPIQVPGERLLLRGHERQMKVGYTPLTIETPNHRSHLLEVLIVGNGRESRLADAERPTDDTGVYDLNAKERLAVTALAQRYLLHDSPLNPQPVSWKQAAEDLKRADPGRDWNDAKVERVIGELRRRLAGGPNPIRGLLREDGVGEPVGNALNANLIEALLRNGTLIPQDLAALGEEFDYA